MRIKSHNNYTVSLVFWLQTFSFFTWHIRFSTRSWYSIAVPLTNSFKYSFTEFSTSMFVQVDGTHSAYCMIERRGTRWPGCEQEKERKIFYNTNRKSNIWFIWMISLFSILNWVDLELLKKMFWIFKKKIGSKFYYWSKIRA